MPDLNSDALGIWEHLKPAIDKEIEQKTRGMVQRRKMKVTTAPSIATGKIGVTEAFGTTEMVIPFATNLISATVGDMVWVEFMYGATNAFASMFASADEKDWDVAGDLSVSGSTSLQNTTVNGVLDVTPRRCYGTLSSEGWYRVCSIRYNSYAEAVGSSGGIFRFAITDSYASYPNDAHTIDLLIAHNKVTFVNEASAANGYLEVDKIRYTFKEASPYYGYVDIHFLGRGGTTYVGVSFDYAAIGLDRQANVVAQNLQSVVESPSGETELTRYTFAANTDGDITSQITFNNASIVTARRNGNIINISYQGNNIAHSDGEVIATFPDGLLPSSTHWCIGSISGVPTVLRIRPVGIDIWYAPSYPSGRLYFEATYVL